MNSFPLRGSGVTLTLGQAADLIGASALAESADRVIRGIGPLDEAESDRIAILTKSAYMERVEGTRAGALLTHPRFASELQEPHPPLLVVEEPYLALAILLEHFHPELESDPGIHPTAVLGKGVRLGSDVRIGPYAVVEAEVVIGDGASLGAHVVVGAGAQIGSGALLHPHAVVYPGTILGDEVILHAGVCVGMEGFGYVFADGEHRKIPQVGRAVIGDRVEIGANAVVDRGSIGNTSIEEGAKLDNLVHIGHNVTVGSRSLLAAQTGIAGSAFLGKGVMTGGQVGIAGHLRVGDGAQLGAQAGVIGDVEPGEVVMGFPARPRMEFLRTAAAQGRVPDLTRRLRALERRMNELTGLTDEIS